MNVYIAFPIQQLSQFSSDPSVSHMQAAKRVLRYLQGTKKLGITYGRLRSDGLHGYADSDYAGDVDNAKSTGGYTFLMGGGSYAGAARSNQQLQPQRLMQNTSLGSKLPVRQHGYSSC